MFAVGGGESSHLCFLEKNSLFVGASFEDHQGPGSGAYSDVDMEVFEPSREAGLTTSKEMMIPLMLFQFHSEPSSLSFLDLVGVAGRLDRSCIPFSTLYNSNSGFVDQLVLECT